MTFCKALAMVAIWAAALRGQTNMLTLACPAKIATSTFDCTVTLSGQASAGAQATINVSSAVTAAAVTAGTAAVAAGKQISANKLAAGKITFIVWGVDENLLQPGAIANITFDLAPAPAGSTEPVSLSGVVQADLAGNPIATVASPPLVVTRLSPCDTNGDGQVDAADVSVAVGFALITAGGGTLPSGAKCDLNGAGACDFIDSQIVNSAARGHGCTAK